MSVLVDFVIHCNRSQGPDQIAFYELVTHTEWPYTVHELTTIILSMYMSEEELLIATLRWPDDVFRLSIANDL